MFTTLRTMDRMVVDLSRGAAAAREQSRYGNIHTATDGRDILLNTPDGWEVDQPELWWDGPAGGDGTDGPWGNPPPGAEFGAPTRRGTSLPAYTRCVQLIAGKIAGMPWKTYRGRDRLDTPLWITDPQALSIDGRRRMADGIQDIRLSGVEFWEQVISSFLSWGEGIVYAPRTLDEGGEPTGDVVPPLYVLHPKYVHVDEDEARYYVTDELTDDVAESRVYLDPRELIVIRNLVPVGRLRGIGAIQAHAYDLGFAGKIRDYTDNLFQRGIPNGYLQSDKPDLTQSQADVLKRAWMRAHGNTRKSIAVLNATTKFHPLGLDPQVIAITDMLKLAAWQICLILGVPPSRLGISMGESDTYSNLEALNTVFVQDTHLPIARKIEAAIDPKLAHGTSLKIDFRGELRADQRTRWEIYKTASEIVDSEGNPAMTIDEIRDAEDLPQRVGVGAPGTHAAEGAGAAQLGGTRNRTSLTAGS